MQEVASVKDEAQLRLIAMWYYVFALLQTLLALGTFIFAIAAISLSAGWIQESVWLPPRTLVGEVILPWLGSAAFVGAVASLSLLAARRVSKRRSHSLCLFASVANLLFVPWGTLLGLYSIVVLKRPSVSAVFDREAEFQTRGRTTRGD